jgi:hypothetical protein
MDLPCAQNIDKANVSQTSASQPSATQSGLWSIGIYTGDSPLHLAPAPNIVNPVLSARDVTDIPAEFVADPFMVELDNSWYMFFEVMNASTGKGEIGLATSRDGLSWQYQQIVLQVPFHLSFPCVFRWNDDFYMVPETLQPGSIQLYRALSFPTRWEFVKNLVEGKHADPSLFFFEGKWWMFACPVPHRHDILWLYYADSPTGTWVPHPCNPIVSNNNRIARPGGRVLEWNNALIRFPQDCYPTYGRQVRAFHISELTPASYREQEAPESPVLVASGSGWNACGMHHIDIHRFGDSYWLACVDGIS